MTLDYNSLLIALAVSASCLAATLFGSWIGRRTETFLLACTFGLVLVVGGIVVYGMYVAEPSPSLGAATFAFLHSGIAMAWGAGYEFRTGRFPVIRTVICAAGAVILSVPPIVFGYDGLGFIAQNTMLSVVIFATAYQYWLARAEARAPLIAITVLYSLTAASFALCAIVLIAGGKLVLEAAPSGWAEDLNIGVCIASMTGIGALSLALYQWRVAARHRIEAITDPLTGLLNRRALFDRYGGRTMDAATAVVVFDIDHFKSINDTHGHAAGDQVLRAFAAILDENCRAGDAVARLGGEEFALVLENAKAGHVEVVADRIRKSFESFEFRAEGKAVRCTVSAGVALARIVPTHFDAMLSAADKALYGAKRGGRNRVELASHLHTVPAETVRTGS
ncbi:GGDEF domain-containing protein [Rhizobium sp. S152]|uniref:GGDEF domain-containing protein n=1 Tax=Rhizobium sp. S152 TaxID=3055038 RepID=UPI0025A9C8A0|nr:GGDEF domain-containing protein [Rhizobium sp. S152]MDM9626226.1 GGDEF domain-containing protein [Rhizobium sp. S152]